MTRLYREGRTETVRSCTNESAAFCKIMDDKTKTVSTLFLNHTFWLFQFEINSFSSHCKFISKHSCVNSEQFACKS